MARPTKEINDAQLRTFLQLNPSLEMTASFFECSPKTIEKYINTKYSISFSEFRDQNLVHTRKSLIHKALKEALKDKPNTIMLLFCLKNLCGWKDKVEHSGDDINPIRFAYDPTRKLNTDV